MKRTSTISRLVEFGLRLIGMWPDSAYPNLYWSMYMTMLGLYQYFQYSYIVTHFDTSNLSVLTDCLGLALANTSAFLKLFFLRWNRRTFYNIVAAVKRDWNDRVVSDSYSTMMAIANQSSRYSVVLIGLHFLTGFSLSIGAYMFRTINTDSEASTREFPVKMQFSFVVSESPVFECILFGQIFFLMLIAPVVGMINALLATLYFQYSYVYEHFDFNNLTKLMDGLGLTLAYTLTILKLISLWFNRRIFADILIAMDDDWKDSGTNLRECVMMNKANLAHRCSNAIISVNAIATFLYFIEIHVRGYTRSKNGQFRRFPIQVQFSSEIYKTPVYELVGVGLFFHVLKTAIIIAILNDLILTLVLHVSGQIDIMCQELKAISSMTKSKSKTIGDAAYETVWYELSTSECRILLFVILRSQKQLTITAGKVMDMTLEGFTNYSYFFAQLGTNDFSKLMDGLSITLDYTLTFLKLLSLWHNRRIFSDILDAMNDDWNNCSTHTCMMMNKANLAHRCSNVMLTLNSLSVIFYFVGNYMSHRTISTDFREFPIQIQFPFHATDSPIFEFIVLGLFFHVWETAIVIALLNSLILTLSLSTNVEGKSGLLIQSIVPYIAVTLEAFVFCFAGEYLSTKSKSISDAAYETLWYDLSTSECRILLLIIVRSQKRLTITAGKIMDLTLEGFTSVMKASASYMSVLHVMY
ncbi:PREDICTED: uncharacterized protein LOC108762413 [Trachymyrmex cornetzi]|uniref:uncharacterized protein LOC108762413 n=1 Tax=Trachymyrmex cornetzi TaxID=471704 RepID=UPI00084F2FFB|nr:PREDICTED: uncharacterized protein LOC108762413 [Trachymyrmex cornetzi]